MAGRDDHRLAGHTGPYARFDDLTPGGVATEFSAPESTLVALHADQVVPLLDAVEEATVAGWWAAGFLTYEAATCLDPSLTTRSPGVDEPFRELPLAWFGLFAEPRAVESFRVPTRASRGYQISAWRPAVDDGAYRDQVEVIRQLIGTGETYQCNLTVPIRSRITGNLFELYRDLALAQRGAHNAYLDTGRFVVASASPELFFDWTGDLLTTRPMKGTAARGRWPAEDAAKARELLHSPKERAENLMIVDLLRNDLGKLAEWGRVEVPELCTLQRFETLWQTTSTVTGRVRPNTGMVDVFRALFPCGSVTGAPKARTMALIAELEQSRRGVYCGAVGLVAPPDSPFRARFNVAIRTVLVDRLSGDAVYGVGGGITWDSSSSAERAEIETKAAILHSAPEEFQLLETMACHAGAGVHNLESHLQRLSGSADYFGFHLDLDQVRAALCKSLGGVGEATRVRLLVDRQGLISVELAPMPLPASGPVRLAVDAEPVSSSDIWLYHKTTRRATYQSRAARHPEVDDVIMVNERGELTETTVANLAVRFDGRWYTPPLDAGCLPGVKRRLLLDDEQLAERVITRDDLGQAEGVAVVSSLRGWRAAAIESPTPAADRTGG
ncbi:MAG TPA: chorismate-binding protein [Candidatus Dormibacteraeota bacterium]|nr:chorismate-binding protein [Candidatus Dormibacteraeota bacterium]